MSETTDERQNRYVQAGETAATLEARGRALETERDQLRANAIGATDDVKTKNAGEIRDRIEPALQEIDDAIDALPTDDAGR